MSQDKVYTEPHYTIFATSCESIIISRLFVKWVKKIGISIHQFLKNVIKELCQNDPEKSPSKEQANDESTSSNF